MEGIVGGGNSGWREQWVEGIVGGGNSGWWE